MELNRYTMIKICKIAAFIILFYVGLQNLAAVGMAIVFIGELLSPFLVGAAIAFILNVPMRFIERTLFENKRRRSKKKSRAARPVSLIIALILVIGVIFIVMFIIIPQVGRTIGVIASQAGPFFQQVQRQLLEWFDAYPEIEEWIRGLTFDWESIAERVFDFVRNGMGNLLNSTVSVASSIVSGIVNFVMSFIFAIYILMQKERLARQVKQILYAVFREDFVDQIIEIGRLSEATFSRFLSGQCLEAVILGTMFVIAMTIFRFPYALLVGVLIAFTALIPIFGAFIGCFIGAFLILIVDPVKAFWFVVMFVILQQLEGNLIYPHVVGGSVGLPSLWVLVAVTLGGNLMGIAGMLIFIPAFSVLYTLLRAVVYRRLSLKNIGRHKWMQAKILPEEPPEGVTPPGKGNKTAKGSAPQSRRERQERKKGK